MEKAYIAVRVDNLYYTGSAIASALLLGEKADQTVKEVEEKFPNFSWEKVSISDLYLHKDWIQEKTKIVLTKNMKPYLNALKEEFPSAEVLLPQQMLASK